MLFKKKKDMTKDGLKAKGKDVNEFDTHRRDKYKIRRNSEKAKRGTLVALALEEPTKSHNMV